MAPTICNIEALLVGFALVVSPASAATIAPKDAVSHIGQNVTVEGVASVHVSPNATFIDIGGRYPRQEFTAVIFKERQGVFGDVVHYDGKVVDVDGTVRMYRGKPEIILLDPSELRAK